MVSSVAQTSLGYTTLQQVCSEQVLFGQDTLLVPILMGRLSLHGGDSALIPTGYLVIDFLR